MERDPEKERQKITGKYNRKSVGRWVDGTSKAKKRIECRIRHMTVRYSHRSGVRPDCFRKQKICRRGVFLFLLQSVLTPQNHCHLHLDLIMQWGKCCLASVASVVGRWTGKFRQSGKPLCTGASLWAVPKLARGLRPLEPRHVNGVSIPAKCPPDIPTEHLLID